MAMIKIAKSFSDDDTEALNKLLQSKSNLMNSNSLFNLAIACLEKK
jgi:hypothetical protein